MKNFSKKLNKANQYVSEKLGSVKGTELDQSLIRMEKNCQAFGHMINEVTEKMQKFLQISSSGALGRLKTAKVPPDRSLSEVFSKFGTELTHSQLYSSSLQGFAEAIRLQCSYKEQLDETVTQEFLDPLGHFSAKELKEINYHYRKMCGRRLDYDSTKRKNAKNTATQEELDFVEDKFQTSMGNCLASMEAFLDNDVEMINQLLACARAFVLFHQNSLENFNHLVESLAELSAMAGQEVKENVSNPFAKQPLPEFQSQDAVEKPWARALYNFVAENEDELSFFEGSCLELISRVDDNWFFGSLDGVSGYFPVNYVDVVVPITN